MSIMKRALGIFCISTYILTGVGCSQTQEQIVCAKDKLEIPVSFIGGINANGMIKLEQSPDNSHSIQVTAVILDPEAQNAASTGNNVAQNQSKVLMVINGIGHCENGVLVARFGADAGKNADYKIAGGRMTAVLNKRQTDTNFGYWDMSLISNAGGQPVPGEVAKNADVGSKSEKPQTINLSGFWKDISGYAPAKVALEAQQH